MRKDTGIKRDHFEIYDEIVPVFRIFIIAAISALLLTVGQVKAFSLSPQNVFIYAYGVYSLLLIFRKARKKLAFRYPFFLPVADISLLTVGIAMSGGAESPYYIFYAMFIAFLAISYGLKFSIIGTLICIAWYTAAILYANGCLTGIISVRFAFFLMFSVFTGYISEKIYKHTYELAVHDGLTSLYSHQFFYDSLEGLLKESQKTAAPVSLALIDVDNFKAFNDRIGHLEGDKVLVKLSSVIKSCIRSADIAARYGGDEIVIIFPDTEGPAAAKICERIRERINAGFASDVGDRITISIGIATYPENGTTSRQLFDSADKALYEAKQDGKNKTVCCSHPQG